MKTFFTSPGFGYFAVAAVSMVLMAVQTSLHNSQLWEQTERHNAQLWKQTEKHNAQLETQLAEFQAKLEAQAARCREEQARETTRNANL
jgi:hypothetical protein